MSEQVTGDIARQMAASPIHVEPTKPEAPVERAPQRIVGKANPFAAVLGPASFMNGDGRQFDRTSGWGNNKVPHKDGGTQETAAWVVFKPFKGVETGLEGRIYKETYMENGVEVHDYSVTIPFIKVAKGDAAGTMHLQALKDAVWEQYTEWRKTNKSATSARVSKSAKRRLAE